MSTKASPAATTSAPPQSDCTDANTIFSRKVSLLLFPALLVHIGLCSMGDDSLNGSASMSQGQEHSPARVDEAVKTILVVEDDNGIGAFLAQAITQETSHLALLVSDGFQALNAVANIKPSLFILDYQLPRMNGIELYDKLHAMKGMEDVPAVIISARLPKKEIEQRKIVGMSKPLELDDFLQMIEKLLS